MANNVVDLDLLADELLKRLQDRLSGEEILPPKPNQMRIEDVVLSPRQHQIILLLGQGMSYKLIAHEMGVTEGTLKVYMSRLMRQTGKNRIQLALLGWGLAQRIEERDQQRTAAGLSRLAEKLNEPA